jgi:hypothetical protein
MRPTTPLARFVRHAFLLVACVAAVGPALAQDAVSATSGSPAAIARIRAAFAEIEREAPGYRRTKHDVQGFSLEGGELTGFYDGTELRKLHARLYGETWQGTQEFYFSDGRLVFIHTVQDRYDEPYSGRVQWRIEHRFYFDRGQLIRRIRTVRPVPGRDVDISVYDPAVPLLLREAELFAACAAAAEPDAPQCTAPDDLMR